jgi:outer membrane protein TolC
MKKRRETNGLWNQKMKNIKFAKKLRAVGVVAVLAALTNPAFGGDAATTEKNTNATVAATRELSLDQCLTEAQQNSHRRPASKFAVLMAEAQHRQALAGYWPQISGSAGYQRMDESPDFLFPASSVKTPAQTLAIPNGGTIPITFQTAGGPVTVPVNAIPVPAQNINVPAQDIKLMDPDNFIASMNATWLIYDGGMRQGLREQTAGLVDMMKQEARRTELEIADSVRRMYYGAVLARQLHQLGDDTLARMEATLNLTETMYKEGSGKVMKTDWLDNKVMVETLRSMVALLEKNDTMAQAALANTMGLPWNTSIKPLDKEIPFTPFAGNLDDMVSSAYQFNPDWNKVEAGIRAAEGAVRTANSDYYPKLAVTGELHKWWNDYNAGMATENNKEGWTVGVGLQIPIFSGFLTKNKVAETRAQVDKIKQEQFLLQDGIGLQIKDAFLSLNAAEKSYQATLDAMTAATENRDLNTRAYQNELVETEKVIRAQLMEALMSAQHYKARYDHVVLQSQIDLLVGTEIARRFQMPQ